MQQDNKNPKYEYLKQYLQKEKNIEYDDALDMIEMLFDELPKNKREKNKRLYQDIVDDFKTAFENQLKQVANCPYIKIEISSQPEHEKLLSRLKDIYNLIMFSSGYFESNAKKIDIIEECLTEVVKNAQER